MPKAYTATESGKINRRLRRKQQINAFDKEMNQKYGKKKTLSESDLASIRIIAGYNPGRLKYWLKLNKKKISSKAIKWMEQYMGESIVDDYFPESMFSVEK